MCGVELQLITPATGFLFSDDLSCQFLCHVMCCGARSRGHTAQCTPSIRRDMANLGWHDWLENQYFWVTSNDRWVALGQARQAASAAPRRFAPRVDLRALPHAPTPTSPMHFPQLAKPVVCRRCAAGGAGTGQRVEATGAEAVAGAMPAVALVIIWWQYMGAINRGGGFVALYFRVGNFVFQIDRKIQGSPQISRTLAVHIVDSGGGYHNQIKVS